MVAVYFVDKLYVTVRICFIRPEPGLSNASASERELSLFITHILFPNPARLITCRLSVFMSSQALLVVLPAT